MKVAFITNEGELISQHFGRASYYLVVEVADGKEVGRELRDKMGHHHFSGEDHTEGQGQPHGYGPGAESRHARMAESIKDCEALVCGGMGRGAYESMQAYNVKPVVTDIQSISEALAQYINGELADLTDRLH